MATIDAHSNELIVKLHGSLGSTDGLVLGSRQYQEFKIAGVRQYFRDKLKSVFCMVPVVVIGHSMSDPDLQIVVECAREISSVTRPIYMLLANVSAADANKYLEQYNVHLLSYEDSDGTHRGLIRLMRHIDRFVIPRTESVEPLLDFPDAEETAVASSLYLFRTLWLGDTNAELVQRAVQPQLLAATAATAEKVFTKEDLETSLQPEGLRSHPGISSQVKTAITILSDAGLTKRRETGVQITSAGTQRYREVLVKRELAESQVFGLLEERLEACGSGTSEEKVELIQSLKRTLLAVFRRRGLSTSGMLFRSRSPDRPDMPELFEVVMSGAAKVRDFGLRVTFCDFVMDLLTLFSATLSWLQRERDCSGADVGVGRVRSVDGGGDG